MRLHIASQFAIAGRSIQRFLVISAEVEMPATKNEKRRTPV
jgi:hypothetical protein